MAVTTTNLGVITAYGDAVAAGYTGTKAEWQALMASYATVGQQAVDAKNAAVAAKDTAVSKATEATTAANTATTKANEASASAQSIAQSASQIQENTDDITQLKSDLTDVNAELADVRVGANGVTYASAGAAVRGQIGELKNILYNSELTDGRGSFDKRIVQNSYVNNRGRITTYVGWDRTDYLWVGFAGTIKITATEASSYNCFYDAEKNWINFNFSFSSGENIIEVPVEAKYMILSGSSTAMSNLSVSILELETRGRTENIIDTIQVDVNNKQIVILNESDIEIGNILSDGTFDNAETRRARTNVYYPILRTENKFVLSCPGWQVAIVEYSLLADGTYSFLKASDYRNDGFVWWAATGTTHIKLVFRTSSSNTIDKTLIRSIASSIRLIENRSINKYLKMCTFNMARDYPSLTGADTEGIQKQIHNYLNFIGGYNPDIIQAQEAGGQYWDDGQTKNMNSTVFDRKYLYSAWPSHNRKTWSKYNISEPTYITFEHKYGDKTRFYTKMYLHFEGKTICLLNTHCEYEGTFAECREGQFEELATEMAKHEYCILCGDFNAYDPSEFSVFSNYNMANCGDYGNLDTWLIGTEHPEWENKCVDNIITTKNIVIQNVEVGPYNFEDFSDHAPLIADLQIR